MKFFNSIRRKILGSGFGKYVLYAIGEIILVVIGILLAIGINDHYSEKDKADQTKAQIEQVFKQLKVDYQYTKDYIDYLSKLKKTIDYYRLPYQERKGLNKPLKDVSKLGLFMDRDENMFKVGNRLIAQINNNDFSSVEYSQLIYNIQADYISALKNIEKSGDKILAQNSEFNDQLSKKYDWFNEWKATINCKNECTDFIRNNPEFDKALVDFQYEKTFVYRVKIEQFQKKLDDHIRALYRKLYDRADP